MTAEKAVLFRENDLVFVPEEGVGFLPAMVSSAFSKGEEGKVRLSTEGDRERVISKVESKEVERMDPQSYKDVADMITLKELNNASLLYNLRLRYSRESMEIYTNIGAILVAINPFMDLGLYNADIEDKYLNSGAQIGAMPPHIFKVAEAAFLNMRTQDKDQSCVITGESGAGKTETTKRFLQYVSEKSKRNRDIAGGDFGLDTEQLRQQILDSNPFMEAFGNAKTLRNDNSSRFGKLIEMFFEPGKGVVVGAQITNYLLEKSRVVRVGVGERNYHIFYQLCDAASTTDPELKKKYKLQTADMFNYTLGLNKSIKDIKLDGESDAETFNETRHAMKKLNMKTEEIDMVFQICSGILHLGNVEFKGEAKDEAVLAEGVKETALESAANLLGVDADNLASAIIFRKLTAETTAQNRVAQAEAARDALAKFVYDKMFDWLIVRMNQAMAQQQKGKQSGKPRVLGVLDIFGFETFDINSFEQMCINFCNEKLQSFFNLHVFKKEQAEYEREGIDVGKIGFSDNQGVIDVLEKAPKGVMVICDDLINLEAATDKNFLKKVLENAVQVNAKNAHEKKLFVPRLQDKRKFPHLDMAFAIQHFAGLVSYNVEGFLEKNKDTLLKDLRICIADSKISIIKDLFPAGGEGIAGRNNKYRLTLGTKFRNSLNRLMERLNLTNPQFVRCIKPNDTKNQIFDPKKIYKQLNEAGLLEVCKIRKLGYPISKTHREFLNDYLCLDKSCNTVEELCASLEKSKVLYMTNKSPNWQIGKTKVFLRSEQNYELETKRAESLKEILKIIHNFSKKWLFRSKIRLALKALKKIKKGILDKNPESLDEGLNFFIEKGPLFAKLPIVLEGLEMMKGLRVEYELLKSLREAVAAEEYSTIKVKLKMAEEFNLVDHPDIKQAKAMLRQHETKKEVDARLNEAIGSQNADTLVKAIAFATENGYGATKECKRAETLLHTLQERTTRLDLLRAELGKKDMNVDELARLVQELRAIGLSDDHPLIVEAARKGDLIIELDRKRVKQIEVLEKQLNKNLKAGNLRKLEELVNAAVALKYTGELVTEAIDMIKNLKQRQDLLEEVGNASRVVQEKSKLPEGISPADLTPLTHAIKTAEGVARLNLDKEIQVIEGKRLIEKMNEQIVVQKEVDTVLKKENQQGFYKMLEKVQALGLQTKAADELVQKVRELEMLTAKAEEITNEELFMLLRSELRVQSEKDRKKLLVKRIQNMYHKEFAAKMKNAWKSKDLYMSRYYKVRSDADFVSREHGKKAKDARKRLKHAYEEDLALTKSLLEMDDVQEKKAIQISETISRLCDGVGGAKKESFVASMTFVVELGICDPVLSDEIFIQVAKHLTANPNLISKVKAWKLLCLCSTYFGVTERFLPYVLAFLQNTVNDSGLEGNYAKYILAQLSCSVKFNPRELKIKPGRDEVKAFFERPPVLAQLELVDSSRKDIPIPPDFTLQQSASIIRKGTGIMIELSNPEWAVFLRAKTKPNKQTYKTRLENFYRYYKPENLGNVDQILAYYRGHEESLFKELVGTSNYGPEPNAQDMPQKRKGKKSMSSRSQRGNSKSAPSGDTGGDTTVLQEIDDLFDDKETVFTVGSKVSVASAVSKAGSVVSKMFRRARGLSTVRKEDLDIPNPTIAWPLPWWVFLGDVMNNMYQQNLVPVLLYKRRLCKTKGKPDPNLFLQLQQDFLDGILTPQTEGENAKLSAIILCIRLLRGKKKVPYGDKGKLLKAGLLKCIPRRLKRANKDNEDWLDAYVEVAADKSNDLVNKTSLELQTLFFNQCVTFPTYGMSFFFAQVLKGNVKSYIAKAQTDDTDGGVKVGVNQTEIAFFDKGEKTKSLKLTDLIKYSVDGTTISLKFKKASAKEEKLAVPRRKSLSLKLKTTVGNTFASLFGPKTEVVQLYTLQPREMFDIIYLFKHLKQEVE